MFFPVISFGADNLGPHGRRVGHSGPDDLASGISFLTSITASLYAYLACSRHWEKIFIWSAKNQYAIRTSTAEIAPRSGSSSSRSCSRPYRFIRSSHFRYRWTSVSVLRGFHVVNVLAHNAAFYAELPIEPPEPRRTGIRFRMQLIYCVGAKH